MRAATILVVEDDPVVARNISEQLARIGHTVVGTVTTGGEALQLAREKHPDVLLMDILIHAGIDGAELARQIRSLLQAPVIYLTAYADDPTLGRAIETDTLGYLLKPFDDTQLRTAIEIALHKYAAERKLFMRKGTDAVTRSSIYDVVVASDADARVIFLNPPAEVLTGWSHAEAIGRGVAEVVRLTDEERRKELEVVPGIVRRALLVTRGGVEHAVDVSISRMADVRGVDGGAIVVMRESTDQYRAEAAEALNAATARFELALAGSNTGVRDYTLVDGKIDEARAYSINCWTPLGYLEREHNFAQRYDLLHPEAVSLLRSCSTMGSVWPVSRSIRRPSKGSWLCRGRR